MPCVLRVIAFAGGRPCPISGMYLADFDFDAFGGLGHGNFTDDPSKAMRFSGAATAIEFWNTRSKIMPTREDGRPNRPLTCTTFTIEKIVG